MQDISASRHRAFVLCAVLLLGGCSAAGIAVGAGATAGTAAMQERGFAAAVDDTVVEARINAGFLNRSTDMFARVGVEVVEGRVLLTGAVPTPADRIEAARIAWRTPGVRAVINELAVDDTSGIADFTRDAWISTQLRTKITVDSRIDAINYTIDTVNGTVFLLGIAQSAEERDRVIAHARGIPYVRHVVDHTVLKDDPARNLAAPAERPPA